MGPLRVTAALAAAALLGTGCLEDVRGSGTDAADGVAAQIGVVVDTSAQQLHGALATLDERAECLGQGAVDAFGEDDLEDYGLDEGLGGADAGEVLDETGTSLDQVQDAVAVCMDVKPFLVDLLVASGFDTATAECVADFTLDDARLREPFLVSLLLGDPGVLPAVGLAARAATACDVDPDLLGVLGV